MARDGYRIEHVAVVPEFDVDRRVSAELRKQERQAVLRPGQPLDVRGLAGHFDRMPQEQRIDAHVDMARIDPVTPDHVAQRESAVTHHVPERLADLAQRRRNRRIGLLERHRKRNDLGELPGDIERVARPVQERRADDGAPLARDTHQIDAGQRSQAFRRRQRMLLRDVREPRLQGRRERSAHRRDAAARIDGVSMVGHQRHQCGAVHLRARRLPECRVARVRRRTEIAIVERKRIENEPVHAERMGRILFECGVVLADALEQSNRRPAVGLQMMRPQRDQYAPRRFEDRDRIGLVVEVFVERLVPVDDRLSQLGVRPCHGFDDMLEARRRHRSFALQAGIRELKPERLILRNERTRGDNEPRAIDLWRAAHRRNRKERCPVPRRLLLQPDRLLRGRQRIPGAGRAGRRVDQPRDVRARCVGPHARDAGVPAVGDRRIRPLHAFRHERQEQRDDRVDARRVEQVGTVRDVGADGFARIQEHDGEIGATPDACARNGLERQAGDRLAFRSRALLELTKYLEDRVVRRAARRIDGCDQMGERQFARFERGQQFLRRREQMAGDGCGSIQPVAKRQRVHEEADHLFGRRVRPAFGDRTDHDVAAARELRARDRERRLEHDERRDVVGGGDLPDLLHELGREHVFAASGAIRQPHRSRPVGGQVDARGRTGEAFPPDLPQLLKVFDVDVPLRPRRIVPVLQRERRECRRLVGGQRCIGVPEVAPDRRPRRGVHRDVVNRDHQDRTLRRLDEQRRAEDRAREAIEQLRGLRLCECHRIVSGDVAAFQPEAVGAFHDRDERAGGGVARIVRAQDFVTVDDRAQRAIQPILAHLAGQDEEARRVEHRAACRTRFDRENPLFREGQRHRRVAVDADDVVTAFVRRGVCQRKRQFRDGRCFEYLAQRQDFPGLVDDARDHANRDKRMAAERKEVVVAADAFDAEQFRPQRGDGALDLALRRFVLRLGEGVVVRLRQCATVELAVWRER
ncbi:hypothetical protein BLA6860_07812 [Burkholderia lata]|nr:hypothetical protein BLA6860_07812 [Burkholderia lata]